MTTSKAKILLVIVSLWVLVAHAQSATTSTPPASPSDGYTCFINCEIAAVQSSGCSNAAQPSSCICASTAFQTTILACVRANCTASELQTAQQLQQANCEIASVVSVGSIAASATQSGGILVPPLTSTPSPTRIPGVNATPSSSHNSNTSVPTIVGGVVGGVIGVVLIAGLVFFIRKRRRTEIPPSSEYAVYTDGAPFGLPS